MTISRRTLLGMPALFAAAHSAQAATAAGSPAQSGVPGALPGAAEQAAAMAAGRQSSLQLTRLALARIRALDRRGPRLHAMIELNPEAEAIARRRDAERRAGHLRSPLHGVPVVLKDNIATGDRMLTTAGSLALAGQPAAGDARLVQRLREAGLVIVGKTNLSEWANLRSARSLSGWSARGGLTRNPHVLDRNASGSSSGSAVAVAAGYVALAIGTETDGSITSPAQINGVAGLKPTVGLISRHGIIPIAASQDTAGPMARSVRELAMLLQVLAGPDPADAATTAAPVAPDYLGGLSDTALRGARLGVVRNQFGTSPEVAAVIEDALRVMKAQGAEIIDPLELPSPDGYADAELEVLLHEIKDGMATWLAAFAPHSGLSTLADLVAWNRAHAGREMGFFGQDLFERAVATEGLSAPKYLDARAKCLRLARDEGVLKLLADHQLDALVAPTGDPAWVNDFVNGDHVSGGFTSPAAVAGLPHLSVPAGQVAGLPVSVSFVGAAWSEARLLQLGHAYEQASHARRPPRFLATLALPDSGER